MSLDTFDEDLYENLRSRMCFFLFFFFKFCLGLGIPGLFLIILVICFHAFGLRQFYRSGEECFA